MVAMVVFLACLAAAVAHHALHISSDGLVALICGAILAFFAAIAD